MCKAEEDGLLTISIGIDLDKSAGYDNDNNNNNVNDDDDDDLEGGHPQSGSLSTWFLVELEFGNAGFWKEGKTGLPGEKPLGAKERTNNKLYPHNYGINAKIWTQAMLVVGECSHHCAIPCSPYFEAEILNS